MSKAFNFVIDFWGRVTVAWKKNKQSNPLIAETLRKVIALRDLAKVVFHGSVLNDILENNHSTQIFVDLLKSLSLDLNIEAKPVEEVLAPTLQII